MEFVGKYLDEFEGKVIFNYKDENFIKSYGLFEKESKKSLTDLLEYIFIELPKFTEANKDYNNKLH